MKPSAANEDKPSSSAIWLGSWRLSRRMAQQASLESQSNAQALAVLSQLNHVPQRQPLHVDSQLLISETTSFTEVTLPLSEVQINQSHEIRTLVTKHLAYHLLLKMSPTLLNDRLNEWGRDSPA